MLLKVAVIGAAIGLLSTVDASTRGAWADETPLAIDKLRITRDRALNRQRWVCVTDQAPAMETAIDARRYPGPKATVAELCEVAAEEAARRGIFDALYARIDPQRPVATWKAVLRGGLEGGGQFTAPNGKRYGLTCPMAFEAGYRFGFENPGRSVGTNLSPAEIATLQRRCFEEGSTLSRRDGIAVGARRGQAFARNLGKTASR